MPSGPSLRLLDEASTGATDGDPATVADPAAHVVPAAVPRPLVQAPDTWIASLEMLTLSNELSAMMAASPLLRLLGRGDRHPVLVMPGFIAGDSSTLPLRYFIRSWGYWAHGWRGGDNLGPTPAVLQSISDRLTQLYGRHGRTVTLVGWSLGGLFARQLARAHPEKVRQVITLASPLQLTFDDRNTLSFILDRLRHRFDPDFHRLPEYQLGPLPVPATSIYTRMDGVARWQTCLDVVDHRHENVEIYSTHVGHGYSPAALYVLANRLRQPEGEWRPFRPPPLLRPAFPMAPSWDPDHHR
jgi:pimeloyl-ACP methyl ester carboxylesterase